MTTTDTSYYYVAAWQGATRVPGLDCGHKHETLLDAERCRYTQTYGYSWQVRAIGPETGDRRLNLDEELAYNALEIDDEDD